MESLLNELGKLNNTVDEKNMFAKSLQRGRMMKGEVSSIIKLEPEGNLLKY
jgi:hypothetical protein